MPLQVVKKTRKPKATEEAAQDKTLVSNRLKQQWRLSNGWADALVRMAGAPAAFQIMRLRQIIVDKQLYFFEITNE